MANSDMRRRLTMMFEGSPEVIFGVPPITTRKHKLLSLKAFGGTEQNGTPTPSNPVNIVCNNGVLKARHQSGLPLGYTLLEYIASTGTQYIDTGIYGTEHHGMEIKFNFPTLSSAYSGRLCGGRTGASATNAFAYIGTDQDTLTPINNSFYLSSNNGTPIASIPINTNIHTVSINFSNNQKSYFDGQEIQTGGNTISYVHQFTTNLFRAYNGTSGWATPAHARIYFCKITDSGELVRDFIPAKNSNNVVGMYDLVSGQFFTNQGTGDFVAGNEVSDLVEIYTDGTVETINVHGKNLFDVNTMDTEEGWYISNGVVNNITYVNRTIVIDCKPNTKYSFWHTEGAGGCRAFTLNKYTIELEDTASWLTSSTPTYKGKNVVTTVTTSADAKKLYILAGRRDGVSTRSFADQLADFMVAEGELETATPYEPYFNGGTATAVNLLQVGDYIDTHSILDGVVRHKVGVRVLDGTESFDNSAMDTLTGYRVLRNVTFFPSKISESSNWYCTHFKTRNGTNYNTANYATRYKGTERQCLFCISESDLGITSSATTTEAIDAFKSWLLQQYQAGTPVIVLYPLATETTESVTPQTLAIQSGTNVIDITQASLNNLELEVKAR